MYYAIVNILEDKFAVTPKTGWKETEASSIKETGLLEKITCAKAVCIIELDGIKIIRKDLYNKVVKKKIHLEASIAQSLFTQEDIISVFHNKMSSEFIKFKVESEPQELLEKSIS